MSTYCYCASCPTGFYNTQYSNNLNCESCTTYCDPFGFETCEASSLPTCAHDYGFSCYHDTLYAVYSQGGTHYMSGDYQLQYSPDSDNAGWNWLLLYQPTTSHDYYFTDLTLTRSYTTFTVTSGSFVKNNQFIDATGYTLTITGGNTSDCGGYPVCNKNTCSDIEITIEGDDELLQKSVWMFKQW